jgi:hypothetical protein
LERRRLATIEIDDQQDLEIKKLYLNFEKAKIYYYIFRILDVLMALLIGALSVFLLYAFFRLISSLINLLPSQISPLDEPTPLQPFFNYTVCTSNFTRCLDDFMTFSRFINNFSNFINNHSNLYDYKNNRTSLTEF